MKTKKCPHCEEAILADATTCKFCEKPIAEDIGLEKNEENSKEQKTDIALSPKTSGFVTFFMILAMIIIVVMMFAI